MAGIGFSINEVLKEKKLTSKARAYAYATVTTTGPLLFGILVLLAVYAVAHLGAVTEANRNMVISMITYGLLASLLINGFFSFVISRYLSDCLYEKKVDQLLTTYWGSQLLLVLVGGTLYGLFLLFAGIGFVYSVLAWLLFCELLMSWNAMIYLTVTKDYIGIFKSFLMTTMVTFVMGTILVFVGFSPVIALVGAITLGYAMFVVQSTVILYRQFPVKIHKRHLFTFLNYFDQFWKLGVIGLATQVALLSHIVMTWFSPIGQQVKGLFYIAPYYDITVFLASLTITITSINFIVSTEVTFFKAYRNYYLLYSQGASLQQLQEAEDNMMTLLRNEIKSIAWVQLIFTLVTISFGTALLTFLPLGFNNTMRGYFRILCLGYAIYAIANVIILSTMYFGRLIGAYKASIAFAGTVVLSTLLTIVMGETLFYGFGFLLGALVYFIIAWIDLETMSSNLMYQVLGSQPIVYEPVVGAFAHLADWLQKKTLYIYKKIQLSKKERGKYEK